MMTRETAAERVYQGVLDQVRRQELQPGDVLREDGLAERFDTSRTPVREALRRLIQDGLVEQHQSRLRVRRLTRAQVDEVYPIVGALEALGARLAATQATEADLVSLAKLHERMAKADHAGDTDDYRLANLDFHARILAASGNPALVAQVDNLRIVTGQLRNYQLGLPGRTARSCAEHADLLACLRARDPDGAEAAMRRHLEAAHHVLAIALASGDLVDPTPAHTSTGPTPSARTP